MRVPLIITALSLLLFAASCTGGMSGDYGDGGGDYLVIKVDTTTAAEQAVDLLGPTDATLLTVEYFIYGTQEDYGDDNAVPMSAYRLEETSFGPLAYGEELADVDLSAWAEYPYIYVRHLGALPNVAHRLETDRHYQFSAYMPGG